MPIFRTPYFSPLNIPGCSLWMDAADSSTMTLSSSSVIQWNDKSGNLRNAASNVTSAFTYPTFSANTVNITGSQGLTITNGFPSNPYCIFVVGTPLASTASWRTLIQVVPGGTASHTILIETGSTRFGNWFNNFNPHGALTWGGSNALAYVQLNADLTMNATTNGTVALTSSTAALGAASGAIINIGNAQGSGQPWGSLNEMIIYNSILSLSQRQQVESFLAQKWDLTALLPAGHPGLGKNMYKIIKLSRLPYYRVFNPQTISSLVLWLDAADSTTVTGTSPITAWTDKSAGRTVTITSGPTYGTTTRNGLKTMSFNNNVISSSIASAVGTGDFTLIAVWYQSSAGTNTVLSLGTVASSSQSLGYSGNKYNFYQYGSLESAYTTGPGWVVQVGTRISSIKRLYITGTIGSVPASDSFNVTDTTVTIGKGDNFAITGEIAEIMVYTGTMSDTNRQLLEGYLAQKWGLTGSLVAGHPSLTVPVGAPATGIGKQTISYLPRLPTFSPTSITGLRLWMDATDTSSMTFSSGSNISQWRDKSGLGNHATATGSPVLTGISINAYPAIVTASGQYFTGPTSVTGTTLTVFAVAKTTRTLPNGGLDQRLVSLVNGANVDYGRADSVIALFNQGSGSSSITTWRLGSVAGSVIATNTPFQVVSKYDGTNGSIWEDGSLGGSSASSGTFGITKYGIGNQANPTSENWIGSIGEVIIYNTALTDTQRQLVEGYLAWKWGLQASLPAGHPYKSSAP